MKYILIVLISIVLFSCSNRDQKPKNSSPIKIDTTSVIIKDSITNVEDTIINIDEVIIDSFPHSTELIIYPFYQIEMRNNYKTKFIPLTDSYIWSDHEDYGIFYNDILDTLTNPQFLNLIYCGSLQQIKFSDSISNQFKYCGTYDAYWHLNDTNYNGIHFEESKYSNWIGTVNGDLNIGLSVRCVKSVEKKWTE